jgi:hypothetical protein
MSMGGIDTLEILFQDGLHGGVRQNQFAQVAHMGLAPVGLALVTETVAQEKALEPMTATAQIINGIGASPAEVANGLIGGLRHIDARQFASTQKAGESAGIPFVGLEGSARLPGDEGGSGDQAGNLELFEPSRDHKPAGSSFVSDLQLRTRMRFADATQDFFDGVQVIGDRAKGADFAFGTGFGNGDGDRVFVDIEAQIECSRGHGVVVSLHSHDDESERIPAEREGRSCGTARQRATRDNNNGNHTAFVNSRTTSWPRAVARHRQP